jgi:hypothetical protein
LNIAHESPCATTVCPRKCRVNSKQIKHLQHDCGPPHYRRAGRARHATGAGAGQRPTCQC